MQTIRMLGRLLWKEGREGWVVVAITALAPSLTFKFANMFPSDQRATLQFMGAVSSLAAIMLWAVLKGDRLRNEGKLPLAHLPANPILERTVSLGLPLIVSTLAGAWLGRACALYSAYHATPADPLVAAGLFALYGAVAFAGCCLISAAVSTWAGVAAGLVWVGIAMGAMDVIFNGRTFEHGGIVYLSRACVASIVCLVLFLALAHKRRFRFAWAPPIVLLAAVMLGPPVYESFRPAAAEKPQYGGVVMSPDGAFIVSQTSYGRGRSNLYYLNKRAGSKPVTGSFQGIATPVALDNRGCAYILQSVDNRRLRVLAWDGRHSRHIADIPGTPGALDESRRFWARFGSVSPDRRYLLFAIGSGLGGGADLWVVDLRAGDGWIVSPNRYFGMYQATWLGDRLAISGYGSDIRTVDLTARKVSTMRIPGWNGE